MYAGLQEYFETLGWEVVTAQNAGLKGAKDKEIVDYVLGLGLDVFFQGLYKKPKDVIVGPQRNDPGWRGRFARENYRLIMKGTEEELVALGFSPRRARLIIKERPEREERWQKEILWSEFEDRFHVNDATWRIYRDLCHAAD
jgi:hypothetical protein